MSRYRTVLLVLIVVVTVGIINNIDLDKHPKLRQAWNQVALPFRIARLATEPPPEVLPVPVDGVEPKALVNTWGAPRTPNRKHEGVDIFAPRGTPVLAAAPGYLTRMGDGGLGGVTVWVTGAGGRSYYYAHLDRRAEGLELAQPVSTGTVLGYVGNTGNARTTPAHLHFGVYTREGAINPWPLLRARLTE